MTNEYIKPPVEIRYKNELDALKSVDIGKKPENWVLSPKAVRTFILGGIIKTADGKMQIKRKFYGNDALVERCIITLAGNRGLMLVGEPGTAKTMLSELLSAACCGISTNTVQGTAGTTEDIQVALSSEPMPLYFSPPRQQAFQNTYPANLHSYPSVSRWHLQWHDG